MIYRDVIKLSIKNLRAQKMRSFLTMLGIIIGISSIITVTSVIAGAQSLITNQIRGLGSNVIGILPGGGGDKGPPTAVFGIVITTLKDSDTQAIKKQIPHVIAASSYVSSTQVITVGGTKISPSINGTSADYPLITDTPIENGTFFSVEDERNIANVAVIGSEVKNSLFGDQSAIGQKIKIKQTTFSIIGEMEPQGTKGFQNLDNSIFIPLTTAQKRIVGIDHLGYMRVKIDAEENVDQAVEDITLLLRERHHITDPEKDDFTVRSTADAAKTLGSVTNALQFFLIAIIGISLIVGGIGIMNIMLAAVNQRIREIGLRKAVGATRKQIINQFLTETIIISFLGAIIGLIIGIGLSYIVSIIVNGLGYNWDFVVSIYSIIIACVASIMIGLIFGIYPARKAAKLDPIVALRYE